MINKNLGIIGTGNMASALVSGWQRKKMLQSITGFDVDASKLSVFAKKYKVAKAKDLAELARLDILLLAVKPQQMPELCAQLRPIVSKKNLLLSIAAGLDLPFFKKNLGDQVRVIRLMPNTPSLLGLGATGLYAGKNCSKKDRLITKALFEAVGTVAEVAEEPLLDIVTALSGSGPAFFYQYVADSIAAGIRLGLDKKTASMLAIQTALGSATMLKNSGLDPAELVKQVTSKGGTTLEGLKILKEKKMASIIQSCLKAASIRAKELRQSF